MAATVGPQSGLLMTFYKDVSGTLKKFAAGVSRDINIDFATIDVTSDDDAGWAAFIAGIKNWSGSFEGIFEEDSSVGTDAISFKDLVDDGIAGTKITVVFTTNVVDNIKLSGSALINNVAQTSAIGEGIKFTCGIQGTGALTPGVVA